MQRKLVSLSAALVLAAAAPSFASLTGYEGFAGYNVGDIGNQAGSGNLGFKAGSTWRSTVTDKLVQADTLNYTNGAPLITNGGSLKGSGGFRRAFRELETPIDPGVSGGGNLWISFLFQSGINTEDAHQVRFFRNGEFDGQTVSVDVVRSFPELVQEVQPRLFFDSGTRSVNAPFRPNTQTNLILAHYVLDDSDQAGNQGSIAIWVNPIIGGAAPDLSSASSITTGAGDFDVMTHLSIFSFGGGDFAATFDEIRWGTDFASVTPVIPEPASLGLLAVGACALLRRR